MNFEPTSSQDSAAAAKRDADAQEMVKLRKNIADEERLLATSPNLATDGERVRREVDEGATSETMQTAAEISDSTWQAVRLANLDAAVRQSRDAEDAG